MRAARVMAARGTHADAARAGKRDMFTCASALAPRRAQRVIMRMLYYGGNIIIIVYALPALSACCRCTLRQRHVADYCRHYAKIRFRADACLRCRVCAMLRAIDYVTLRC